MSFPIMPVLPLSMAKDLHKTPNRDGNSVIKSAAGRGNSSLVVKQVAHPPPPVISVKC